jgi:hypothetical protein
MLNFCGIVVHCPISTPFLMWVDYDVQNWFPTSKNFYRSHFQNGHHNTAHKFNIVRFQRQTSLSTHISNFDDIGQFWIFTAHFLYCILAAILKMADISKIFKTQNCSSNGDLDVPNWFPTLKNFYQSPFSKWPPQYRQISTLSDIIKIWYVGR